VRMHPEATRQYLLRTLIKVCLQVSELAKFFHFPGCAVYVASVGRAPAVSSRVKDQSERKSALLHDTRSNFDHNFCFDLVGPTYRSLFKLNLRVP
jgi:hypothetical protein